MGYQNSQYPPPTPEVYSSYNSPSTNYDLAMAPFSSYEQQYIQGNCPTYFPNSYAFSQEEVMEQRPAQYTPQSESSLESMMYSQHDWDAFAASNFQTSTAPPTPENFLPIQHPEPAMDSIPYQSLSDDEDTGEELLGLGLYDTPKSPEADPQLDNYKSLMMNTFAGHAFTRNEPLPSGGKGLKLEEEYHPTSEGEEEDDEEEDGDSENEDGEQVSAAAESHDVQSYDHNWV